MLRARRALVRRQGISLKKKNQIDFMGGLIAGEYGNKKDQVWEGGMGANDTAIDY